MSAQSPQQESWYLRIVQGPMTGRVFPLERNPAIIGRDESCDVVITVPGVSRRHAQLSFQEQWFSIQDLGSTNGTFVNSVRITSAQILQPGDMVSLGTEVTFVLEWGGATPGVGQLTLPMYTPVTPATAAAAPQPKSGSGWLWPLIGCGVLAIAGIIVALVIVLMLTHIIPNPFAAKTPTATVTATPTTTATLVKLLTPTPTVTWTPSPTAVPTHTSIPTPTSTETPTLSPESTPTNTPEPTATETLVPPTSTPTNTPVPPTSTATATATQPPTSTPTSTPTVTPTSAPLAINWELLEKKCISKHQWTMKFRLTASGGKGQYTYYRDITLIHGPTSETQYIYELTYGADASAVGTFFIESGGQRAENKFWVDHPDCSAYVP